MLPPVPNCRDLPNDGKDHADRLGGCDIHERSRLIGRQARQPSYQNSAWAFECLNVGTADRLDFTVIGPAVNEAARIETLCEPLGRKVLVSAEFAAAAGSCNRLQPLGHHRLRGVREPRAIYGLDI